MHQTRKANPSSSFVIRTQILDDYAAYARFLPLPPLPTLMTSSRTTVSQGRTACDSAHCSAVRASSLPPSAATITFLPTTTASAPAFLLASSSSCLSSFGDLLSLPSSKEVSLLAHIDGGAAVDAVTPDLIWWRQKEESGLGMASGVRVCRGLFLGAGGWFSCSLQGERGYSEFRAQRSELKGGGRVVWLRT